MKDCGLPLGSAQTHASVAGALDTRVATSQTASERDELGRLFNTMLDKIAVLIQGMHNALDKVAHELRTPVARLRASAEVALQQAETHPALYRKALADCLEESERLLTMLRTFMDISEAETGVMPTACSPSGPRGQWSGVTQHSQPAHR